MQSFATRRSEAAEGLGATKKDPPLPRRLDFSLNPNSILWRLRRYHNVLEPFFLVAAAQCHIFSAIGMSLEFDGCHERLYLPTSHRLTECVTTLQPSLYYTIPHASERASH